MDNVQPQFQSLIVRKQDCLDYGGDWVNAFYNFDNIGNGILSINSDFNSKDLFVISLGSGWSD